MNWLRVFTSALMSAALLGFLALAPGLSQPAGLMKPAAAQVGTTPTPTSITPEATTTIRGAPVIAELQTTLQEIYSTVGPSVVNIQVIAQTAQTLPEIPGHPPFGPGEQFPAVGVGSGFVWDDAGHIVTNNHVVAGAQDIRVTFIDGASASATIVGTDPASDLAVIVVDPAGLTLQPVTVGDSTELAVGQLVAAIGNPFGLEGTMTFGIVSALGRTLPAVAESTAQGGPVYTIPDIIQTDAPVNPGNSGGVLLDMQGRLIGVPSAIESPTQVSVGIGFAVPSVIVEKVVPQLIETGRAEHPFLGLSGTTLTRDLAEAMNLPPETRGALVVSVTEGTPAAEAGLQGGDTEVTVNGRTVLVGGDVIVAVNDVQITSFESLTTYLARNTQVGDTVELTVLRDGETVSVPVTLADRPVAAQPTFATPRPRATPGAPATPRAQATPRTLATPTTQAAPTTQATPTARATPRTLATPRTQATPPTPPAMTTPGVEANRAFLGINVITLTPGIAQAMNLPSDQRGVLIQTVQTGGPADSAGLQGSNRTATVDGQRVMVGGDVIVALDGQTVSDVQDLIDLLAERRPGDVVTLTILREGAEQQVDVTLGTQQQT